MHCRQQKSGHRTQEDPLGAHGSPLGKHWHITLVSLWTARPLQKTHLLPQAPSSIPGCVNGAKWSTAATALVTVYKRPSSMVVIIRCLPGLETLVNNPLGLEYASESVSRILRSGLKAVSLWFRLPLSPPPSAVVQISPAKPLKVHLLWLCPDAVLC